MPPSQLALVEVPYALEPDDQAEDTNHGEVFTRRWVVDLILDLAGYTADRDLVATTAVEPACGAGAFVIPMAERLIASCATHGRHISDAMDSLLAFDLQEANVLASRLAVKKLLIANGLTAKAAQRLAGGWITHSDFLLVDHSGRSADFVLGNPPYVRLEDVPAARSSAYRQVCKTMRGRSDLYVGFLETGLKILAPNGVLSFIVADRWMRNQYGKHLRELITSEYSMEVVLAMHDVDVFEASVSAYPAVTVIKRSQQGPAVVAETTAGFGNDDARELRNWYGRSRKKPLRRAAIEAATIDSWFEGEGSWPIGASHDLALIAELESRLPSLEDPLLGTRVGIGIASGADDVFITRDAAIVEDDRLLPLVMAKDIASGTLKWSGRYLVNPWSDGKLVELDGFPRLNDYYESHRDRIERRHVAQKNNARWYRTIDRVEPGLRERPKLLLPDIKARIHPVLDEGEHYPHHNLYFVTAKDWPIESLGGLLLSDIANLFVGLYCVKMRGGCYRFQAQYLRKIRVPRLEQLSVKDLAQLADVFRSRDTDEASKVARRLYGVDS